MDGPTQTMPLLMNPTIEMGNTVQLKEVFKGIYDWGSFKEIDNTFYDPFREVLIESGLGIENLN